MINQPKDTHPITYALACTILAKKSVNIRIHDEIAKGNKDRAARFLFNRAVCYLDDVQTETDLDGMDPDTMTACRRILVRGFGPMIARDLMGACLLEVIELKRKAH
jgi:hypothetical protein